MHGIKHTAKRAAWWAVKQAVEMDRLAVVALGVSLFAVGISMFNAMLTVFVGASANSVPLQPAGEQFLYHVGTVGFYLAHIGLAIVFWAVGLRLMKYYEAWRAPDV